MKTQHNSRTRNIAIWACVAVVSISSIIFAANSPLLEWRDGIYIAASFAGVIGLSLLLLQPLLAARLLPGLSALSSRLVHRWTGAALLSCVVIHVIGLWITSPPDVIDALLFVSATPFSIWGVIAMWSVLITAILVIFRRSLSIRARTWQVTHRALAIITVIGTVVHAILIEGTMEVVSKTVLCGLLILATALAMSRRIRVRLKWR